MSRSGSKVILTLIALTVLTLSPAHAGTDSVMLDCWPPDRAVATEIDGTPATLNPEETSSGAVGSGNRETQSLGWLFEGNSGDSEIQCTWIVPDNYVPAYLGEPMRVRLYGWAVKEMACSVCSLNRVYFRLDVRRYMENPWGGSGYPLFMRSPWLYTDEQSKTIDSGLCSGFPCHLADILKKFELNAYPAGDPTAYQPGDLVYFRITRDNTPEGPPLDRYAGPFHVTAIQLTYPVRD